MPKRSFALAGCCLLLLALAGCSRPFGPSATIDWVHFIKWNDRSYEYLDAAVLADPGLIGAEVGRVKHKLEGNVDDPGYRSRNGDAAYLDKGTPFYEVEGVPTDAVLAVADARAVNGYRLFGAHEAWSELNPSYSDLAREAVRAVTIYWDAYGSDEAPPAPTNRLEGAAAEPLLALLDASLASSYEPDYRAEQPGYRLMVFDTGEPLACAVPLFNDGTRYYWNPSRTFSLPDGIAAYLGPVPAADPEAPEEEGGEQAGGASPS